MSSIAAYRIGVFSGVTSHDHNWPSFLRDGSYSELDDETHELEALVRSGDYFVTIATEIDQIARASGEHATKLELENIVSDLIYLQDGYTITKRKKED